MTIDEVCKGFDEVLADHEKRHERAKKDRERLMEQIDSGQAPTGHRPEFIKNAAMKVIDVVGAACMDFDQKYPGDRATAEDALAVIMTAANMVLGSVGKTIESDDKGSFSIVNLD